MIRKKYVGGLGALGSWASGGMVSSKTQEHEEAEARARDVGIHRDSILWFLRQRLELCCRTQQDMMEARLTREMEKSRSMLSRAGIAGDFAEFPPSARRLSQTAPAGQIPTSDDDGQFPSQGLTDEQIQMFEEGNQDMMKHFESSLDKVRYVSMRLPMSLGTLHPCWGCVCTRVTSATTTPWGNRWFFGTYRLTHSLTEPLRSHYWKYPSYNRCSSTTLQRNQPISNNWCQTRFRQRKMLVAVTRNLKKPHSERAQPSIPSLRQEGYARFWSFGILYSEVLQLREEEGVFFRAT